MNVDETLTHESALHTSWNNDIPPALHVESGAIVQFDCLNDSGSRITPETDSSDLPDIGVRRPPSHRPSRRRWRRTGDVLQVDILDVDHDDWGITR